MSPFPFVQFFESVGPRPGGGRTGVQWGLAALREHLERLRDRSRIVPLPESRSIAMAGERLPTPHPSTCSLAFVGAHAGQFEYALPILTSLGLPAHFFIPLDRVGCPGRAGMAGILAAGRLPGIRLEADLAASRTQALRDRIELLCRTAATLTMPGVLPPRYVWLGDQRCDRRLRLLLAHSGYAGALCRRPPRALRERGLPLFAATDCIR